MQFYNSIPVVNYVLNSYGPEIDCNDLFVLDYLFLWSQNPASKKFTIDGHQYFWASSKLILQQIPYLNIKERRLKYMFAKYQELGLLEACPKSKSGNKSLYRLTGLLEVYTTTTSSFPKINIQERIEFLFPKLATEASYEFDYGDTNEENESFAQKCRPEKGIDETSRKAQKCRASSVVWVENGENLCTIMQTNSSIIDKQIINSNTNTCASKTDQTSQGVIGLQSNSGNQEQDQRQPEKKIEQPQQELFDLKEKEKKRTPPSSAAPPLVDQKPITEVAFDEIWNVYNKKIDKEAARRAYNKLCKEFKEDKSKSLADHLRSLYISVKAWSEYFVKSNTEKRFIPHLSTFLNNKRFEAQPEDVFGSTTENKPEPQTIKKAYSASGNMYD